MTQEFNPFKFRNSIIITCARTIRDIVEEFKKGEIAIPIWQRECNAWTEKTKRELIDSIFKCIYIPPLIILPTTRDKKLIQYLVDGYQRLTAIMQFMDNKYPYIFRTDGIEYYEDDQDEDNEINIDASKYIAIYYDKLPVERQKKYEYRILTDDARTRFMKTLLTIAQFNNGKDGLNIGELQDLFNRIQNAQKMSPAESLRADPNNLIVKFVNNFRENNKEGKIYKQFAVDSKRSEDTLLCYVVILKDLLDNSENLCRTGTYEEINRNYNRLIKEGYLLEENLALDKLADKYSIRLLSAIDKYNKNIKFSKRMDRIESLYNLLL